MGSFYLPLWLSWFRMIQVPQDLVRDNARTNQEIELGERNKRKIIFYWFFSLYQLSDWTLLKDTASSPR